MKKFIKYILSVVTAVFYTCQAMAGVDENSVVSDPMPTIKVAVFITQKAADVYNNPDLDIFEYLEQRESEIRQMLNFDGVPGNSEQDFGIEFTVKALLTRYQEPKHRGLTNPYSTFKHEGIDQVFDELSNHKASLDFLNNPANDSNNDGIWDDRPDANKYYFANKNNLDIEYIESIQNTNPDVVLIIADEQGESLIVDEVIWDISDGSQYDKPLYAVVNAEYFAKSTQALTFAFFNLFCRADYSDADLNTDNDLTSKRSLMSFEWTGVEGENRLTDRNKQIFRHNMGKLKLNSNTQPLSLVGKLIDMSYVQNHVDNSSHITFTSSDNGTPNDKSDDIPTIISTTSTASEFGDDVGQDVPLASSSATFVTERYSVESISAPAPIVPSHAITPEEESLAVSLPIDFENDISNANFIDYTSDDFGAESTFETNGGNSNTSGMKVVKRKAEINQWAITTLSHVNGLSFTGSNKRLKMDVKSPDTTTDVMLILEDEEGNLVTKEYVTNDLVVNGWKELEFDFDNPTNRTGIITNGRNYETISIQFNSCKIETTDKTYFVDNIKKAEKPNLAVTGTVNISEPLITTEEGTEILVTVRLENKGASTAKDIEVDIHLPNETSKTRYSDIRLKNASSQTEFNISEGIWKIREIPSDPDGDNDIKRLQFYATVNYISEDFKSNGELDETKYAYDIKPALKKPSTDAENNDNEANIRVIPKLRGTDIAVSLTRLSATNLKVRFTKNGGQLLHFVGGKLTVGSNVKITMITLDCNNFGGICGAFTNVPLEASITSPTKEVNFTVSPFRDAAEPKWNIRIDKENPNDTDPANNFARLELTNAGRYDNFTKNNIDPVVSNNVSQLTLIEETADLSFTEFNFKDDCIGPGTDGQISIKIKNNDPDKVAKNVRISHFLSPKHVRIYNAVEPGINVTPASIDSDGLPNGVEKIDAGTITIGDIAANTPKTITLNVKLLSDYDTGPTYTLANILSDNESDYSNNDWTAGIKNRSPFIQPSGNGFVDVNCEDGLDAEWLLTLENKGDCAAQNVRLNVQLPGVGTVTTDKAGAWTGTTGVWNVGNLEPGVTGRKMIKITFDLPTCVNKTHTFSITSDNQETYSGSYNLVKLGGRTDSNEIITTTSTVKTATPLNIYPNPFTGLFKVVYEQSGNTSDEVFAQIYDLSGRVVLQQRFDITNTNSKQELEIDGSQLPNGSYIIELNNGAGIIKRSTLIKK